MRYQLNPSRHASITSTQLRELGATNIRERYWMDFTNQPKSFTFDIEENVDISILLSLGAVWCLTKSEWRSI